jgi:Cu-Zn family superoxide dismutase
MKYLISLCATAALLTACGQKKDEAPPAMAEEAATGTPSTPPVATPPAAEPAPGATATLAATQGNKASGTLTLNSEGSAVRVTGSIQGLAPNGEFGFHIHEKGDCSAPDASSAGGHFNPGNAQHGDPKGDAHHAGDMLNARSDAQGVATVDATATGVTLGTGQPNDVTGKAIVMHEKADDYQSQPAGNSGARIACGVIGAGGM